MTEAVFDFKSIRQKLERQEQKAEHDEKNPPVELSMYGYPSNLTVPLKAPALHELPYTGTPHEWRRVNAEYREYAITQGRFGDEFVKLPDGSCLSRLLTD